MPATSTSHRSNGARLISVEGLILPLKEVSLTVVAAGGVARVTLLQRFTNPHDRPLKLSYTMPLPASGAVAGYRFRMGDLTVAGQVMRRREARERFDQALVEGRTAALLDQDRANLFTLELGNIPPCVGIEAEIDVDQRLDWLAEGMWEWRFPTAAAPRYLGDEGRVPDAGRVTLDVASGPLPVRATLDLVVGDPLPEGRMPESPSHRVTSSLGKGVRQVALAADGGTPLDRDIVVRWPVARSRPGVSVQVMRPAPGHLRGAAAFGLLTIVPPAEGPSPHSMTRDLIVLLDTSGSMRGRPLEQARRVVGLLVDALSERDRLEMIAFSSRPARWRPGPVPAGPREVAEAHAWLGGLEAGGGTEMLSAVVEAVAPLSEDGQRQVVLVTDGEIGFESEVVRALLHRLPSGSRLHAVGIGSAPNDALLRPLARAGRGTATFVGLDEDPGRGVDRLLAATGRPLVVNLEIAGAGLSARAPRRLPDLMAGAPVLAFVELPPAGTDLTVRGRSAAGAWEERLAVPVAAAGSGCLSIAAIFAREAVEDLEMDIASGKDPRALEPIIERLGLDFGLSTRLTSWVAIATERSVDPGEPVRRVVIPQQLPYGMSAEGVGLRPTGLASTLLYETSAFLLRDDSEGLSCAQSFRRVRRAEADEMRRAGSDRVVPSFRWVGRSATGSWILEFEVEGDPLDWDPSGLVVLLMRDGSLGGAGVEAAAGTARGRIAAGSLVRVALELKESPDDVMGVTLISDQATIWLAWPGK